MAGGRSHMPRRLEAVVFDHDGLPTVFTRRHNLSSADLVVNSLEEVTLNVLERVCKSGSG